MPKNPDFAQFFNKKNNKNVVDKKGQKVKNQNTSVKPRQMNSSRKSS